MEEEKYIFSYTCGSVELTVKVSEAPAKLVDVLEHVKFFLTASGFSEKLVSRIEISSE
jgi:hypothetical protein